MGGTLSSPLPLIAVLIPAVGALLVALSGERHRNLRDSWSTLAALALVGVVASMLPKVLDGTAPETTLIELSPGIAVTLRADAAGMIFALLASSLWVLAGIYAVGYYAGGQRAQADAVLQRLCPELGRDHGRRIRWQPAHVRPVLRAAHTVHVPARDSPRDRGVHRGGPQVPRVHAVRGPAAHRRDRLGRDTGHRRELHGGRIPRRQRPLGRYSLGPAGAAGGGRWREGGGHAAAQLAARGNGRADARFGAVARSGRREGGCIRRRASARVRVRRRRTARHGRVADHRGVRRRDDNPGVDDRVAARQPSSGGSRTRP